MKIIIVGCGKIGQKITAMLNRENEHNISVIDLRPKVIQDLINQYDIMGFVGSGADTDTLIEAGIKEADLVIAVTGADELNLLTCLLASKLGNCKAIARIKKPEYNKATTLFKEELGLAMVINPDRAAAAEIARALRFPSAIQVDTFAKGRIEILKFKMPENSVLEDKRISEIIPRLGSDVLICGVERDKEAFIPSGDFVLKKGDLISFVASIKNGTEFLEKIGVKSNKVKDTMIVGGGPISYYLASQLLQTGIDVKIIEQNSEKCDTLCEILPKATIINGDGTEKKLLLEEGIESADSVVCLTNIDEENLILSLFAKSKTKGKLITKINRIDYDEVVEQLDIGTIIYPKDITAEYIVRYVRAKKNSIGSKIETMHYILEDKAEALEFRINDTFPYINTPLEKMNLKNNTLIACINRNGTIIIPKGKDVIMPHDTVIVVTTNTGYKDISDIINK